MDPIVIYKAIDRLIDEEFTDYVNREAAAEAVLFREFPDFKLSSIRIWYTNPDEIDAGCPRYMKIPHHSASTIWIDSGSEHFFEWLRDLRLSNDSVTDFLIVPSSGMDAENFASLCMIMDGDILQILPYSAQHNITRDDRSFGYRVHMPHQSDPQVPASITFELTSPLIFEDLFDAETNAEWSTQC